MSVIPLNFVGLEGEQAQAVRQWAGEPAAGLAAGVLLAHAARQALESANAKMEELANPGSDHLAEQKAAEAYFYQRAARALRQLAGGEDELELIRAVLAE